MFFVTFFVILIKRLSFSSNKGFLNIKINIICRTKFKDNKDIQQNLCKGFPLTINMTNFRGWKGC